MLFVILNAWVKDQQLWRAEYKNEDYEKLLVVNNPELLNPEKRHQLFCRVEKASSEEAGGVVCALFLGCEKQTTENIVNTQALLPILQEGMWEVPSGGKAWLSIVCSCNPKEKLVALSGMGKNPWNHTVVIPCGVAPSKVFTFENGWISVSRRRTNLRWTTMDGLSKGYRP